MQRSKTYRAAAESFDQNEIYAPLTAIKIAKGGSKKKFDETLDVVMRLGVDPRKADQMVRGTVNLPHGTGKTARVIVFATGERAAEAEAAGADRVGSDDLIAEIQGGFLDFDAAVATPDQMGKVGKIARILGPRGLMPNPKTGTVTADVTKAVSDIKGGKVNFRVDKQANLHLVIGKTSFDEAKLVENYAAALDEVLRAKPSSAKGRYLKKVTVSTTMGPGIPVDPNRTRNMLVDEPTEGLAPVIVQALALVLSRLRAAGGLSIVLVEQNSRVALEFSARTVVMDKGRIVYDGASERLRGDPEYLASLIAAQ